MSLEADFGSCSSRKRKLSLEKEFPDNLRIDNIDRFQHEQELKLVRRRKEIIKQNGQKYYNKYLDEIKKGIFPIKQRILFNQIPLKKYQEIALKLSEGGYNVRITAETDSGNKIYFIKIDLPTQSSSLQETLETNKSNNNSWLTRKRTKSKEFKLFYKRCVKEYSKHNKPTDIYYNIDEKIVYKVVRRLESEGFSISIPDDSERYICIYDYHYYSDDSDECSIM